MQRSCKRAKTVPYFAACAILNSTQGKTNAWNHLLLLHIKGGQFFEADSDHAKKRWQISPAQKKEISALVGVFCDCRAAHLFSCQVWDEFLLSADGDEKVISGIVIPLFLWHFQRISDTISKLSLFTSTLLIEEVLGDSRDYKITVFWEV